MEKNTPQNATTEKKLLKLKRDNKSLKNYWFLVSEKTVTIAKQKSGHEAEGMVKISKKAFDNFIKFYQSPQQETRNNR